MERIRLLAGLSVTVVVCFSFCGARNYTVPLDEVQNLCSECKGNVTCNVYGPPQPIESKLQFTYSCQCRSGYFYDADKANCQNINECKDHKILASCHTNANCTDTEGSYDCVCNSGWIGDGKTCEDLDECVATGEKYKHKCNVTTSTCINTKGDYSCECKDGYEPVGENNKQCKNINECHMNATICSADKNSECKDTEGSYTCECKKGYKRDDSQTCVDIDDCGTNSCDNSSTHCVDGVDSYTCECLTGFERSDNNYTCKDKNECKQEQYPCDEHAFCDNTNGSFSCRCIHGYTGNGTFCEEVKLSLDSLSASLDNNTKYIVYQQLQAAQVEQQFLLDVEERVRRLCDLSTLKKARGKRDTQQVEDAAKCQNGASLAELKLCYYDVNRRNSEKAKDLRFLMYKCGLSQERDYLKLIRL